MDDHFERFLAHAGGEDTAKKRKENIDHVVSTNDSRKRQKVSSKSSTAISRRTIEEMLKKADEADIETLDPRRLKTMVSNLEKKIRKNAMLRAKYADTPEKFMESEVNLDEELTKFKSIAAVPSLFCHLIELNAIPLILGLFSHENVDIRLDVIGLISELCDVDALGAEEVEAAEKLVHAFVENKIFPLLVTSLFQLDSTSSKHKDQQQQQEEEEEEESQGIYQIFQILENFIDLVPSSSVFMAKETKLFEFLLNQIQIKNVVFSQNKLYASEILSILLQANEINGDFFLKEQKNFDLLLQALAPFRKQKTPKEEEEEEFVENLFNSLCSLLLHRKGQDLFRQLEGFELMLRFLQEKKFTRSGALRVFNHAVANHSRNCERLIETGCLKHLFPAVMGKKRYKTLSTNKNQLIQKEEENVMSILASLCLYIDSKSPFNAYERLHVKFVENEFEKIDRFIDIFQKYSQRMEKITQIDEKELIEEEEKEELYLQKLDAGLFILQCVSFCLAHCCAFSVKIHAYVQLKFHERAIESEALENVLQEQLKMLGKDTKESEKQKMRLEELLVELHKKNSIQEQPIEEEEKQETQ